MPFIEMPLGEVGEQYAVESGVYDVRILKQAEEASKAKREEDGEDAEPNMLVVTFGIVSDDFPDAAPFRMWFMYPDGGDYDAMRMRELKRLLHWFNVGFEENGFNTEDLENAEASQLQVNRSVLDSGREVNEIAFDPIPNEEGGAEEEAAVEEEATEEVAEEEAPPARRTSPKKPAPKVAPKKAAPKAAPKKVTRR